jgi:hypothetical protein
MTDLADRKLTQAKRTLIHYFKLCWPSNYPFDSDNYTEIEGIVDDIYEAAVSEVSAAMNKHGSQYHEN